jgi:hypothetical protein
MESQKNNLKYGQMVLLYNLDQIPLFNKNFIGTRKVGHFSFYLV